MASGEERVTVKTVSPAADRTPTTPPCAMAISRTMNSPSPRPPSASCSCAVPRVRGRKMRSETRLHLGGKEGDGCTPAGSRPLQRLRIPWNGGIPHNAPCVKSAGPRTVWRHAGAKTSCLSRLFAASGHERIPSGRRCVIAICADHHTACNARKLAFPDPVLDTHTARVPTGRLSLSIMNDSVHMYRNAWKR
jgi:hypothetical protein